MFTPILTSTLATTSSFCVDDCWGAGTAAGTLYAQSGEVLDAERYFKLALEKDPNHRDATQKLEALREMEESGSGKDGMPKFRSPMKKVGGEKKEKIKFEL